METVLLILMFIIGLLVLISIHEFGHFIFAKLFGVYCFEFSVGFGKKIIRRKKKYAETYFCIGVIPLGGYVAMYGEDDDESEKRNEKQKKKNKKQVQEEYTEFTIIDRKNYKLFKKQNKLLEQEKKKLSGTNLKFRDSIALEINKNLGGCSNEEAIEKVAISNVLEALKIEKLIIEEDFYKVVDQKGLPKERDLEHINRGKKFCIMGAGITMNFIIGYILYAISLTCFPHYAITSRLAASQTLPEDANMQYIKQLDKLNENVGEEYGYVITGDYVIFEDSYTEKQISTQISLGSAVIKNGEKLIYSMALPTNNFSYNNLSVDDQLYTVENEKYYYNFYEIVASNSYGETTFEQYYNANLDKINSNANSKEFFTNLFENKYQNVSVDNLTIVKSAKYQKDSSTNVIDSVKLDFGLVKATLDANVDAGYYVDKENTDYKVISGALKMDPETQILEKTNLSFTTHERWLGAEGFVYAGEKWVDGTKLIFNAVGNLFIGKGWDQVGGPIAIFTQSSQIFKNNPFSIYIQLWGLISVNLAVMNLLPIPGLDGWHLLVAVVEGVTRRKMPQKFKKWASRIGLIFVFGLMAVVLVLDFLRILGIAI